MINDSPESTTEGGLLVESPERGAFTPALTNNRWGREKERWGATRRNPVIASGTKSNLGLRQRCHGSRRWGRCGNDGKTSQHRVLLDLRDQAVMVGTLRILVEPMVKRWGCREGESAHP